MVQCVICKDSKLEQIEPNVLKCKICKNKYVLGYEILKHEEEISDPYSEDPDIELSGLSGVNEPVILFADDNDFSADDEKKSGFYSFDYIKRPGITIENIEEHIPTEEENNN